MTSKIARDFRPYMGQRITEHMSRYNEFYSNPDAPADDFIREAEYLSGAEMVLTFAEISYKFNRDDNGKRYVSVTLEGETYSVEP